ncbi:BlaI/MecI/CopY family transcriptional regulator [bacterium]|nr:BlaI/MecI/CopY family transcriptional regulator [bacterium]
MARKATRIGPVQMGIMRVLWRRGNATAREITDSLATTRAIAHSTVQTLLRKLEAKGVVAHDVDGRTFLFRATVTERQIRKSATKELLSRVYGGSTYGLVAHLVRNEKISREELTEIRKLIDEAEGTQ